MQLKSSILKILCCVLVSVPLLIPFSVSAEIIDSNKVIGINVWTTPISEEPFTNNNAQYFKCTAVVNVEFELDQSYLGWANIGFTIKYKGHNYTSFVDYTKSWSGNYYVNGSSILIEVPLSWNTPTPGYYMGSGHLPSSSSDLQNITYSNQGNVTPIGDLSTLQDILDVLNDIQQNVEIDVLSELQSIISNTSLANQYLETLTEIKQWRLPFESYNWNFYMFKNGFSLYETSPFNVNYFEYPIFIVNQNDTVYKFYTNNSNRKEYTVIFLSNRNLYNLNELNNYFSVTDGSFSDLEVISSFRSDPNVYNLIKFKISNFTVSSSTIVSLNYIASNTTYFIPIYFQPITSYGYVSTDFALLFGLTNDLLDNLGIIAQGTTNSNNSSSSLESQNTQFSTDSSNLINIEDTMQNQMNNSLNNINVNMDIGNTFGSKFLTSAEWVRNQFNTLTQSTPFGSIVSFSLLVGLALLLMGKFL